MDLTNIKSGSVQESPKLSVIHEKTSKEPNVIKKQQKPENQTKSCARNILNMTENEEIFHDAYDISSKDQRNVQSTKNMKDTKSVENIEDTKDVKEKENEIVENTNDIKNSQNGNTPKNFLNHSETYRDNAKNSEKENANILPNQQATMFMMVLTKNNLEEFNTNLMPIADLINCGLKSLQEQIVSSTSNTTQSSSVSDNSGNFAMSVTKIEMSISNVESCSNNEAQTITERKNISSSFNSPSQQSNQNDSNCGILSTVAQVVKCAFKNISDVVFNKFESTEIIQRREIVKELTSLPESSTDGASNCNSNLEIRRGKRARDITEMSSWADPVVLPQESRSPLAKRQKGWYKIKARPPISRMRNNNNSVTSSRGISSETQVFRQGSLTVGDTVLPLPTRAHEFTQTE